MGSRSKSRWCGSKRFAQWAAQMQAYMQQREAVSAIFLLAGALQVLVLPGRYNVCCCLPHALCLAKGHPSRASNGEREGTCNDRCSAAQRKAMHLGTCSGWLSSWTKRRCISSQATKTARSAERKHVSTYSFQQKMHCFGCSCCLSSEAQRVWVRKITLSRSCESQDQACTASSWERQLLAVCLPVSECYCWPACAQPRMDNSILDKWRVAAKQTLPGVALPMDCRATTRRSSR